jgi:uncharacterized protein (TIGR02001 family)
MKTQTMKKTITLCAALLIAGSALTAQDATPTAEPAYAVTVDFPYVTKYVFRGLQLARSSLQPSVEVAAGDFYSGVWNNTPLRNEHDGNASKELDLYVGYTPKLAENLKADLGATYYWYPRVHSPVDHDSFEVFGGLNWTLGNFTPAVYLYRDIDLDVWTVQGSIGYSIPLKSWGTSLDCNATVGAVSPDHGESYNYYSAGVNLPVKLSDVVKLNFGLTYTENDRDGEKDPGLWGSVGITASF